MHYIIIQPATYERNLSGVCYMPYWTYTALKERGDTVSIFEDQTLRQIDELIRGVESTERVVFLIDCSSTPQVDICLHVYRDYRATHSLGFIGHEPMIRLYGLPYFDVEEAGIDILKGVFRYIYHADDFRYALLSDCDSHLKKLEDHRKVVPLAVSIGCRRGCPYCYTGYSNYPYGRLDLDDALALIDHCADRDWNIHFIDENFYHNKDAEQILRHLATKSLKFIALTDSPMLTRRLDEWGEQLFHDAGSALNEVGLETVSDEVLSKRQEVDRLINSGLDIFWLTVTFFPDETLASLAATGRFLRDHGYEFDEVLPRVRTNSTVGGLGQFFQMYPGTPLHREHLRDSRGVVLTARPVRLWPSFIGHRFLAETPHPVATLRHIDTRWLTLYGCTSDAELVYDLCDGVRDVRAVSEVSGMGLAQTAIYIAQMARLGVIA